ncbi:MAG TPA: hypothetical protein VJ553_00230 [Candidatus Paceibacterota bacterium]|nr:hypothetical protein [Candidatus Paceibacterota bacterium]
MDILVHIPHEREDYVWGTKLNPKRGFNRGYWTLPHAPLAVRHGDRIWFSDLDGDVVASAEILTPRGWCPDDATCPPGEDPVEREKKPAVCFDIMTVIAHAFPVPHALPVGFRGFRYVRRANLSVPPKRTKALELVGAKKARKAFLQGR